MGIVASIAEKLTVGTPVERLEASIVKAAQQITSAQAVCEAALARASEADPDSPTFNKSVSDLSAVRARLDALVARRDRLVSDLTKAREAESAATRCAKDAEFSALDQEVRRRGEALTAAVRAAVASWEQEARALRDFAAEGDRLLSGGDPRPGNRLRRDVRWLDSSPILGLAAHILGGGL
jgi:hypothetical protein